MTTMQLVLLGVFVGSTVIGYLLINNVPSLLHTPLMSGMNALSGVTLFGAIISTAVAVSTDYKVVGYIFGSLAIILAMINLAGGFYVTDKMLNMIVKKKKRGTDNE